MLIALDFDGTLAFSKFMWTNTTIYLFEKAGIDLSFYREKIAYEFKNKAFPWHFPEMYHKFTNSIQWWNDLILTLSKKVSSVSGIELSIVFKILKDFPEIYLSKDNWVLYDDTIAFLETFKKHAKLVLVSNHVPEFERILEFLNIKMFFNKIYNSTFVGYCKPNPIIFNRIKSDWNESEYIMIGDNYEADFLGSSKCGFYPYLVRNNDVSLSCNHKDLNVISSYLKLKLNI
ncbi:MAG: HAD-IA family hydrolase [Candidatus Delongbacteria bacterium]|nr:HAD-IA family hydrolase [Candidatus Delongbacteria bacterium]MBN2836046.1 HAD-IA family hydrolase [Candidatus Delongbacteria bacterium]